MNTPFLDRVYAQVIFDKELVFKFFTVFSLFEYALKQAGFCKLGGSGEAQPEWDRFANGINENFCTEIKGKPELAFAVNYMLTYPVMKQTLFKKSIIFKLRQRPNGINDTAWLAVLIRGVRNNLFHGAKFRYDTIRDSELIESSLIILESWAQLNSNVEQELRTVQ